MNNDSNNVSQAAIMTTASHYLQQWTLYIVEQYTGNQVEQLAPATRQWLHEAVTQRMARTGSDRSHVLHQIERELHGETPDQHRRVMIPNQSSDTISGYVLVIEDWVQVYVNERGQQVWSVLQEPLAAQQP